MVAGFPANAHPSAPALPDCEAGKGRLPFAKRGRDVADARADGAYGQAAGSVAEGIRLSGIGMSIYVEILIRAPMDALWAHTQTPELHERWDLRFSEIAYVPRSMRPNLSVSATPHASGLDSRSPAKARASASGTW